MGTRGVILAFSVALSFPGSTAILIPPPAPNASRWAATGVELVKKLILKTKTSKGLKVFFDIMDQVYKTGRKVADDFKQNMGIVLMTFFQLGIIWRS